MTQNGILSPTVPAQHYGSYNIYVSEYKALSVKAPKQAQAVQNSPMNNMRLADLRISSLS